MKKKEVEDTRIQTSFMLVDDSIIEQCYEEGKGTKFAIYKDGDVEYKNKIEIAGQVYIPINGEEVLKKAVLLPTKAEEYGTDEELDNEIKTYIKKW